MAPLNSTCTICNASGAKRCSTCHSTFYCSPACQKKDWSLHKILCKDFSDMLSTRPSDNYKLAILLATSSSIPQLTWIFVSLSGIPHIDDLLPSPASAPPQYSGPNRQFIPLTQSWSPAHQFNLEHTVGIYVRDTFGLDGSEVNECVLKMTNGKTGHEWKGPVVITRKLGTRLDSDSYGDVGLGDLRVAREYFVNYGWE